MRLSLSCSILHGPGLVNPRREGRPKVMWQGFTIALREGIELPEDVLVNLREVARETRLELPAAHG